MTDQGTKPAEAGPEMRGVDEACELQHIDRRLRSCYSIWLVRGDGKLCLPCQMAKDARADVRGLRRELDEARGLLRDVRDEMGHASYCASTMSILNVGPCNCDVPNLRARIDAALTEGE